MTRHEANLHILEILYAEASANPSLRFGQLLSILDVVLQERDATGCVTGWSDEFDTESVDTLTRIKGALAKLKR